ncbi:MAG: hypothetical protein MUE73_22025 [Planctomycetes bacterium]|jgi:hypothetical protein|nr:hypothetical protein [Planctomycetota bacterium]
MGEDKGSERARHETERVVIRPWPKSVLLYPTLLLSVVFGLLVWRWGETDSSRAHALATAWLVVFGANLAVMTFQFSRVTSLAGAFAVLAAVFLALFLGEKYDIRVFHWLTSVVRSLGPAANAEFYLGIAGVLLLLFVLMFLRTRTDWWEVNQNLLIHHHGVMGNVERWPAQNLRFTSEIEDLAEYAMLRSGTLVFLPPGEGKAIRLETVPGIGRIERALKQILSRMSVDIDEKKR